MIKYCGIALVALAAVLILKGQKSEFTNMVTFATAVILFGIAAAEIFPTLKLLSETIKGTKFEGYMSTLLKALGITLAVQFSSELCRDAGETSIASKLELIGKAQILLLCFPLINELIALAVGLMG
jgi:stage III sporulation protein AD